MLLIDESLPYRTVRYCLGYMCCTTRLSDPTCLTLSQLCMDKATLDLMHSAKLAAHNA